MLQKVKYWGTYRHEKYIPKSTCDNYVKSNNMDILMAGKQERKSELTVELDNLLEIAWILRNSFMY